jgi:hypothetical protein
VPLKPKKLRFHDAVQTNEPPKNLQLVLRNRLALVNEYVQDDDVQEVRESTLAKV